MVRLINVFLGLLLLGYIDCDKNKQEIIQIQGTVQIYIAELYHTQQQYFVLNDPINNKVYNLEFKDERGFDKLKSGTEIIAKGYVMDQISEFNEYAIFEVESFNILVCSCNNKFKYSS